LAIKKYLTEYSKKRNWDVPLYFYNTIYIARVQDESQRQKMKYRSNAIEVYYNVSTMPFFIGTKNGLEFYNLIK
jgi:hypothetical protein